MSKGSDDLNLQVYDPRGIVDVKPIRTSARVAHLDGLRLGVLDNSKWNASRLLRSVTNQLAATHKFSAINQYTKESFSKNALPVLVEQIVSENDIVLTAIGD